jgi:hypothetical protein
MASNCSNHGSCIGNGTCNCNIGYEGSACSLCSDDYYGYPDCECTRNLYLLASVQCLIYFTQIVLGLQIAAITVLAREVGHVAAILLTVDYHVLHVLKITMDIRIVNVCGVCKMLQDVKSNA